MCQKNMWNKFKEQFDIEDEPCNYFMEYTMDKQFKLEETNRFENRNKKLKELCNKSNWLQSGFVSFAYHY